MPDTLKNDVAELTVVAIAASAGGLEATSLLAQNMPLDQNCCYVIAQHMAPSHKSMLVLLLSRETSLGVEQLTRETKPRNDVVYVPPPGQDVIFKDGLLQLREPSPNPATPKPSADRLFKSVAEEKCENAIGIVLSGTGSDGSYGVQAIREYGGITIAQEPETCKYESMPLAAIRTGCVDLVLTPPQMGIHINQIMAHPRDLTSLQDLNADQTRSRDLFEIVRSHTGVDFRHYKETTLNRRIQRRMLAKGIEDIDTYTELCRKSVEEVEALYRDLLISVTQFFRDPDQFEGMQSYIDEIVAERKEGRPIRIWVPAAASGEEAYTIAMLVCEALGGLDECQPEDLQVFATDIDDEALDRGRKATYPVTAMADIPQDRFERYYEVQGDQIQISQKLRRMVMFSRHNVFQDAPFIDIDLVSIRNLLIYFNVRLQGRVLTRLLYALRPKGLLFLGTSESLGSMSHGFVQVRPDVRLFRKRDPGANDIYQLPSFPTSFDSDIEIDRRTYRSEAASAWRQFDRLAETIVKDGMVINKDRTVLRIYGDIAPYCAMTNSSIGQTSLSMLKQHYATDASSLAMVALKYNETRSGQLHAIKDNDNLTVQISAYPLKRPDETSEDLALIGFALIEQRQPADKDTEKSEYVHYLEDELDRNRDALQVTVEQLQTSNEELQALNEELQSSNEELQSTNEELETSNEELQSTNEELITVNEELLVNSSQLERTSAELNGLITSLPNYTVMVDQGLIIRYASEAAKDKFKLHERGGGYGHLSQINLPEDFPPLVQICSRALIERKAETQSKESDAGLVLVSTAPITDQTGNLFGLVMQIEEAGEVDAERN